MKVRKLAVALALAGGLGSGVAQALGLGEIELQSYLNQPLDAEIEVNRVGGVNADDVVVNLASERDYERVGLRRDYFLSQLNFSVTTAPDGDLVISVTSREPVREPYLNFLVEVTWPSGRVMREYSVLVDPPVYAEDSGREPAPVQSAQSQPRASEPRTGQRQPAQPRSGEAAASRSGGARTLGPVQASDTLWEIASSVRPNNSVSTQQVMLAIQDLNPDAFINGNINRLKRGEVLRVPDMNDIRARTQAEANREVAVQNRSFAQPQPEPEVDATETGVAAGAGDSTGAAGEADSGELRLVVPGDGEDQSRSEGSAGGDGRQGGASDAGQAVAMEELDRVQRENDELNSRLEDLQDQVETLRRLIELKDSQLAEIQGAVGDDGQPEPVSPGGDTTGAEAGAETDGSLAGEEPTVADGEGAQPADSDSAGQPEPDVAAEVDEQTQPDLSGDAPAEEATTAVPDGEQAGQPAEQPASDDPVAATGAQPEEDQAQPVPAEQTDEEQGFLAAAVELIAGNFLYQIALGGFLVLLLLMVLLISRRRANDDDFYQQLDDHPDDDSFELTLGEEEASASVSTLEEADRYISYGQHDAAAEVLENAISREPSRPDLRLKLLAVYADTGNRAAFDKQYAELEAMEFEDAQPEADALRARLEDVESTPSMDELESELRGGEGSADPNSNNAATADDETNELMAAFDELDQTPETSQGSAEANDEQGIDFDFAGLDTATAAAAPQSPTEEEPADDYDLNGIDFELPEDESVLTETESGPEEEPLDLEDDFSSLELDDAGLDSEPQPEDVEGAAEPVEDDELDFGDLDLDDATPEGEPVDRSHDPEDEAELDESFLDELDAELDKVASEGGDADGLDDLELDVSDDDLALMDEASESEPEDESQLDLGDLELEDPELTNDENPMDDDLSDLHIPELEDSPVGESGTQPEPADREYPANSIDGIDEAALEEEEDFDFLAGTDEVATKLDLARAYVDMGDSEGAREILEEVILEGGDEQKSDAQTLLKKLP